MSKVFVLGNGESRKSFNLDALKKEGPIYGCNALYRDFTPDALVCVDGGMQHEVYTSGYALENKCWFQSWSKLPAEAYDMMIEQTMFDDAGFTIQNSKSGRTQFVLNGTDPNQMRVLYEYHINKGSDKKTIDELLSKHHRWITWVEENDGVHIIPEEHSGWSAGPTAVRIALEEENPDEVYLIGFDLGSPNGLINNVYKGTDNYLSDNVAVTPSVNWINQHAINFRDYPNTKFYKVNTAPLGTDDTCQFVGEWEKYDNLQYIEQENLNLVLDFGWMM
jgi:hypothetical protein